MNKATPNSRSQTETAKRVFEAANVPMSPVVLHRYKEHRDANPKGLTAQELDPNGTAAKEINALWEWLCAQLQIGKNAHLQSRIYADVQPRTAAQS